MTECKINYENRFAYQKYRPLIKSGDIMLCSGNGSFSNLIKKVTNSRWSHVAFIIKIEAIDRLMVLESVESIGVRTVPLSSYLFNYNGSRKPYNGDIMISRHNQMCELDIHHLSKKAIDLLGHQYDNREIMRITAKIALSMVKEADFCEIPAEDDAYICSEYVNECFKSIGIKINSRCGYIIPDDFSKDENINPLVNFMNPN